jgi:hypothetical protein
LSKKESDERQKQQSDNSGNNLIEYFVSIMVAGGNSAIYGQLNYIGESSKIN